MDGGFPRRVYSSELACHPTHKLILCTVSVSRANAKKDIAIFFTECAAWGHS